MAKRPYPKLTVANELRAVQSQVSFRRFKPGKREEGETRVSTAVCGRRKGGEERWRNNRGDAVPSLAKGGQKLRSLCHGGGGKRAYTFLRKNINKEKRGYPRPRRTKSHELLLTGAGTGGGKSAERS